MFPLRFRFCLTGVTDWCATGAGAVGVGFDVHLVGGRIRFS